MKKLLTFIVVLLPFFTHAQVVKEVVQLDTITETLNVIYQPVISAGYYKKNIAVFANDTSQVAIEKNTARGVQNGIYKVYYPSGKLKVKTVFSNGKINGEWTWYGEDGIILVKGVYEEGIKEGYWAYKYLKRYGRYKAGKRNKQWYTPDQNNKKIKSIYKNGVLVKGDGFGDEPMLNTDTIYAKNDTIIVESAELIKHNELDSSKQHHQNYYIQAVDYLASNYLFRKNAKAHFGTSFKLAQRFKKNFDKKDVFQFNISKTFNGLEIFSFIEKAKNEEISVAIIDSVLKSNPTEIKLAFEDTYHYSTNKDVIDLSTSPNSLVKVQFSDLFNNLIRIDV